MKEKVSVEGFPNRLLTILDVCKISQKRFAALGGVSEVTMAKYVRGTTNPSQETLAKWAMALNIDCNWLLTGQGPPFLGEAGQSLNIEGAAALSAKVEGLEKTVSEKELEIAKLKDELLRLMQELIQSQKDNVLLLQEQRRAKNAALPLGGTNPECGDESLGKYGTSRSPGSAGAHRSGG